MAKLFCKNCKYCKYQEFASLGVNWGWFCKKRAKYTTNSIGHIAVEMPNCEKLNQDFHCPDYKRKWWNIWAVKRASEAGEK